MQKPIVQSYLFFGGRCEEALHFYQTALGARIEMIMRFEESPDPLPEGQFAPGFEKKVMHASFRIGETVLMASDGCEGEPKFEGFSLSLAVATAEEADQAFAALADGGEIGMPLNSTFWSPRFGMVTDKFGISWMINVVASPS